MLTMQEAAMSKVKSIIILIVTAILVGFSALQVLFRDLSRTASKTISRYSAQ